MHQLCHKQPCSFFVELHDQNASQIFVLSEKGNTIELHDNTTGTSIPITASHEAAKELFVNQLTVLYGKAIIDCFYPEEAQKEPLTLGQAHTLRQQLNAFQQSLHASCKGNPSKYEPCLKAELEIFHQVEKTVNTAFQSNGALKLQVDSLTNDLSKQLGVSPETVQTCVVAGLAVAAVAGVASGAASLGAVYGGLCGVEAYIVAAVVTLAM